MVQSSFYKYLSLIKLIVWLLILFVDYVAINVFEDPVVAIWILLVWCFLVARWASFFFFLFIQKTFRTKNFQSLAESDSYKLSLLFWMYTLLNIILIFLWQWSKTRGLILLCGFILLLYFLMMDSAKHAKKTE
jgi:uncharacterized membrane protein YesL